MFIYNKAENTLNMDHILMILEKFEMTDSVDISMELKVKLTKNVEQKR